MTTFLLIANVIVLILLTSVILAARMELISVNQKLKSIMAKSQERFDLLMGRLDTITTDIAEDYKTLLEAVQAGGISDESFAKHEANIAKLEELGASVENPVPPVEPPPVEP